MDYFSHAIWGYIFFYRTKKPFYAALAALIPDTFSWMIYFIFNLVTGNMSNGGPPHLDNIPDWVFTLYGISHSLIVCTVIFLVIYLVFKTVPIYLFAWPVAVLMDIPTHSREFLPTPFLWPVSDWHFPGFSWGNGWFMLINFILIVICLTYVVLWRRKNKNQKQII